MKNTACLHVISEYYVYTRSRFGMDTLCFHVHTFSGTQLCFHGGSNTTAWQLKGLVKKRLGVPRRMQRLCDGERELANHATLPDTENALTLALMHSSACQVCEQLASRFCSKCFSACYCSKDCQLTDWREHRRTCTAISIVLP